jgi:RHH-type rel operon transcriptional repressor/antitoxin RelB
MTLVSARLPEELVRDIDETARSMQRSRADLIRAAIEHFMADAGGQQKMIERLRVPVDLAFDWDDVERDLLG